MNFVRAVRPLFVAIVVALFFKASFAQTEQLAAGEQKRSVNVGMPGHLQQVVLPGSELIPKEVDPRRTAIAVRIDRIFPHGDHLRYDLTFIGLEPGTYDLRDYLTRKDGSSMKELPEMTVQVNSILPTDQLAPSKPSTNFLSQIGGYRYAIIVAIVVWVIGLLAILFVGRQPAVNNVASDDSGLTEVHSIQQLIETAMHANELTADQKAALDLKVLNFWRNRRDLADQPVDQALNKLKADQQAGPLLKGLERWFYGREKPNRDEINQLLQPMVALAADSDSSEPEGATS